MKSAGKLEVFKALKSYPYQGAIKRTCETMKKGTLKWILQHQDESDSTPENAGKYLLNLDSLISRLPQDLNAPKCPL